MKNAMTFVLYSCRAVSIISLLTFIGYGVFFTLICISNL